MFILTFVVFLLIIFFWFDLVFDGFDGGIVFFIG